MSGKVNVDQMASEIMRVLQEYADLSTEDMKKAVRKTANTVKREISENAPKDTGKYAKSWAIKKTEEISHRLVITVHSKKQYRLAHLLEHGHVLRGGGRSTTAKPHIKPAEEHGEELLTELIEKAMKQ